MDVNAKDCLSRTALILVSSEYDFSSPYSAVYHDLVNHDRVDVNATDLKGRSAFFWASYQGHSKMVSELLKSPLIDVHAKNKAGSTALDIARELELVEITKCVEKHAKG